MRDGGLLEVERCHDVLEPFQARWREFAAEAARIESGWLEHPDSAVAVKPADVG